MNKHRLLLLFIFGLAFLVIGVSCSREESEALQSRSTPASSQRQERLRTEWLDFNDGLAKAKTENKPIFVEFYAEWCVYCKKFQKETIQNENVARILSDKFVYIRLDAENQKNQIKYNGNSMSNVELTRSFGITSFPSLVFLESGGKPITFFPGFMPAPQFSTLLNYIHQKCYETKISFHDFVRKGRCN
ncbi:MAG: thioredoxin family protein [Syntrophobacterales bacterium]|jgi:thioredoxin-related protein